MTCPCVRNHTPEPRELHSHHIVPRSWGGPDTPTNRIALCPTGHVNTHHLLDAYVKAGGDPGWEVRRRYTRTCRQLAARAWAARPEHPTYTLPTVHP